MNVMLMLIVNVSNALDFSNNKKKTAHFAHPVLPCDT